MIQLGDYPHLVHSSIDRGYLTQIWDFDHDKLGVMNRLTTHTEQLDNPTTCHRCGKKVSNVVKKPEIRFVWCFACF